MQVCATFSTAYVHGGRPGILPESVVASAEPPSLWHPLVPEAESDGAAGAPCNGHAAEAAVSAATGGAAVDLAPGNVADGSSSRASVPGRYLDLDTELAYARVRFFPKDTLVF